MTIEPADIAAAALPALRQTRIAAIVRERGQITVAELVTRFNVSRDTIRRDLDILEQRGILVRTHGGAIPSDSLVMHETSLALRMDTHVEAKRRIGRAASALIRDGETLIVNGGSTTTYFAAELDERRNLMVVTNNLRIPPVLPERAIRAVYVLGGTYWSSPQVTIGPIGFASTERISADTAVIGVTGVCDGGFSIARLEEAAASSSMVRVAKRTIILADSSKLRTTAFAHVTDFTDVEHLVTDAEPAPDIAAALVEAGVEVLVARS
ncbi:DeoR/GlpR family DNA-binding transcription regulator [Lichenicoccus sp.]|uniref:DeoR/GlpR family DNA-binding transcription regulator n=1 Tax=Lichenicoccus sp. TaxID=2781899 RepID=UPI003D1306F9